MLVVGFRGAQDRRGAVGTIAGVGESVERRVAARVGLVGNPSDGYGGAVLAVPVPPLAAHVVVRPCDGVRFGGSGGALRSWSTLAGWRDEVRRTGHVGDDRLISAALAVVSDHVSSGGGTPPGVEIVWDTAVPRTVGLAGSSALAVAVVDAVAMSWGRRLDRRVLAALALRAERDELGIAAGWQDRVVQSFGRPVLVDAARLDEVDGVAVPQVTTPEAPRPVSLVVGWRATAGASSDDYHAPLRRQAADLVAPMGELAVLARDAARAWAAGDVAAVAAALDAGWRVRQACAPLRSDHAALVETARTVGVAATTPGSGGSVVALPLDEPTRGAAIAALEAVGAEVLVFDVG